MNDQSQKSLTALEIYAIFKKAEQPILEFLTRVETFKNRYHALVKNFGKNYDQYSSYEISSKDIENRDPELPCDHSMEKFHLALELLTNDMEDEINLYFPLLKSAENLLKECLSELDSHMPKIPQHLPQYQNFMKIKIGCNNLLNNLDLHRTYFNQFFIKSTLIENALKENNHFDEMPTSLFVEHIRNELCQQCHKTVDEAETLMRDEKISKFIQVASFVSEKCKSKKNSHNSSSPIINNRISNDNPAYIIAKGFIEKIKETQQTQEVSRPLLRFR